MGDVLYCIFTPRVTDGAKERIRRRREALFKLDDSQLVHVPPCDLTMDHADNGIPSDVAYCAADVDSA